MSVLVLGGSGPIGQALARATPPTFQLYLTSRSRAAHTLNVLDRTALSRAFEQVKPRVVIDLSNTFAATSDIGASVAAVAGTVNAAQQAGVERLIYASSGAVYGDSSDLPFVESDPLVGTSPYARWKIESEEVLGSAAVGPDFSAMALRIFNVYGPGCGGSLVNKLIHGPVPRLAMSDRFVRDYVHVDDVAEALIAAATTTSTQTFLNVASGVAIDNLALAGAARDRSYIPAEPLRSFSVGDPRLSESALKWRSSRSALADVARSRPGG